MNAVAAGLRADVNDRIAYAGRRRIEDAVRVGEPDAHGVDEDVAIKARVEIRLAADRRNADAVAVIADARNNACHEMTRLGVIRRPEPQRIQHRDGTRAHGEDVAHDAADAGRRALIGLDEGRVIVTFHLENHSLPVADIDDARILARPADDVRGASSAASSARRARIYTSNARTTSPK